MLTTFLAAQCFQCSSMQVKQQKKSSNKWTCVLCGEKQSLRKVFAQGHMAKEVRKFVQNFNMSRQLKEETLLDDAPMNEEENERKKRRTDWTEYVVDNDDPEEGSVKLKIAREDSEFEPMVVTEVPKALFRKPKLKDYSANKSKFSNTNMSVNEVQQTACKRTFKGNEYTKKRQDIFSDEETVRVHQADRAVKWNALRAQIHNANASSVNREARLCQSTNEVAGESVSKWTGYIAEEDDRNEAPQGHQSISKGTVSKWSCFITEDDDEELQIRGRIGVYDQISQRNISQRNTDGIELVNDERVEDDIHPDFL